MGADLEYRRLSCRFYLRVDDSGCFGGVARRGASSRGTLDGELVSGFSSRVPLFLPNLIVYFKGFTFLMVD